MQISFPRLLILLELLPQRIHRGQRLETTTNLRSKNLVLIHPRLIRLPLTKISQIPMMSLQPRCLRCIKIWHHLRLQARKLNLLPTSLPPTSPQSNNLVALPFNPIQLMF